MGLHFGNLAKVRGIIYYKLSPFEQKTFAGYFSRGFPNTVRRFASKSLIVVPPFIIGYLVYDWGKSEHARLNRKEGGAIH